jgi:hypothetical protein
MNRNGIGTMGWRETLNACAMILDDFGVPDFEAIKLSLSISDTAYPLIKNEILT